MSSSDASSGQTWNETVLGLPTSQTADEAALVFRLSPATVRDLAASGEIPAVKIGRGHRSPWRFNKIRNLELLQVVFDPVAQRQTEWDRTVAAMPELLDTNQVAYVLRLKATTVRELVKRGEIPATRLPVGRSALRFSKTAILRLLLLDDTATGQDA